MTYTIQLTCKGSQELHIYVGRIIGVFTLWYQQALLMETRQIYWQYEQIVHAWTVRHLKCTLVKNRQRIKVLMVYTLQDICMKINKLTIHI